MKRIYFRFTTFFMCLLIYLNCISCAPLEKTVKVIFLNLGDSDSIIIKHNNRNILIDTSLRVNYKTIENELGEGQKIDTLILTHFDYDHIGSASKLINNKKIKRIYMPKINFDCKSKNYIKLVKALKNYKGKLYEVESSEFLKFGELTITILPPKSDYYLFDNSNNTSLVSVVKYYGNSLLLSADICKDRVNEMLNDNQLEHYNILKIPHHGIPFKDSEKFFKKIEPEVSIVTCSTFRHSRIISQNLLKNCGSLYFTDNGSVILQMYENGYSVNQF